MSEQKPEYVILEGVSSLETQDKLNAWVQQGYEVVSQSSAAMLGGEICGYWTTWTMRLRPEWRQEPVPPAVQDERYYYLTGLAEGLASRLQAMEKRLSDAEGMVCAHEEQIGVLELRKLHERLTALESRQRRQESLYGRAFWTNAEINGMKCRVLVSARTEETGQRLETLEKAANAMKECPDCHGLGHKKWDTHRVAGYDACGTCQGSGRVKA